MRNKNAQKVQPLSWCWFLAAQWSIKTTHGQLHVKAASETYWSFLSTLFTIFSVFFCLMFLQCLTILNSCQFKTDSGSRNVCSPPFLSHSSREEPRKSGNLWLPFVQFMDLLSLGWINIFLHTIFLIKIKISVAYTQRLLGWGNLAQMGTDGIWLWTPTLQ